ncbi:MAG: RHS domain-containing protein [Acidobacteria bacterium]|nr:RHS domain-containing protein [Acidobacteriota bacterium]
MDAAITIFPNRESDSSGTLTKYINGPGVDNKLRKQTGSDVRYFIADHLGSTNALTDSSGNVTSSASYDSFGNASGNLATRYKFTGREYDDFTGLHYYRARWYDGNLGRFISEDPIGFAAGDVNLYGYVGNGPLGAVDPSGLTGNEVLAVTQTITQISPLLEQVIATTGSEALRNARLLEEIIANSSTGARVGAAGGVGGLGSVVAYGGTSVSAAGAAPVAGTVGAGLVIGGAIGLPIGIYTSELESNPFVNGPLNPFGKSATEVANESWTPLTPAEACRIHGNSANSLRPTWGYKLYSTDGTFLKNGITSNPVPERRYTRWWMNDKQMIIEDQFPNRREALNWEYGENMTTPGPLNRERYIKR